LQVISVGNHVDREADVGSDYHLRAQCTASTSRRPNSLESSRSSKTIWGRRMRLIEGNTASMEIVLPS
jgi:hypothetical protein